MEVVVWRAVGGKRSLSEYSVHFRNSDHGDIFEFGFDVT